MEAFCLEVNFNNRFKLITGDGFCVISNFSAKTIFFQNYKLRFISESTLGKVRTAPEVPISTIFFNKCSSTFGTRFILY